MTHQETQAYVDAVMELANELVPLWEKRAEARGYRPSHNEVMRWMKALERDYQEINPECN